MTNVIWLNFNPEAPSKGYWCYGWLEEILEPYFQGYTADDLTSDEGAIVVIPAEYNVDYVDKINETIEKLAWSVVILASDERGLFPVEQLVPCTLWVMTPHFEKHVYPPGTNFIGEFAPQHCRPAVKRLGRPQTSVRKYRSGFSGQITHQRRHELAEVMPQLPRVFFNGTEGFTQGFTPEEYAHLLVNSQTVPAPSGPETLDSFRAFEALEAGAIPLLDLNCPRIQNGHHYWRSILGDHPLPMLSNWAEMPEVLEGITQEDNNLVYAWWQLYKRSIQHRILDAVPGFDFGPLTVLVATSPIAGHPDTSIIEETVASVRHHLPDAEIIVMIDGVRPEQDHYRDRYTDYVRDLLWLCNFEWHNVTPMLFTEHQHQANMTRAALRLVKTPNIMFVEHDTPLVSDRHIEWDLICSLLGKHTIDMLRLHYEGRIHPEHEHLMTDKIPVNLDEVWLRRTVQWSQRPHVARTDYYRMILSRYFPEDNRTMIEDRMHSVAQAQPDVNRLAVYCPKDPDGSIVRTYHLDGRKADPKYDMEYGSIHE